MKHMRNSLEELWGSLLSREPALIRQAFNNLSAEDQSYVLEHLQRMAQEGGWQPEQVKSAKAALEVLRPGEAGAQ